MSQPTDKPLSQLFREACFWDFHAGDIAKDDYDEYGKYRITNYYLSESRLKAIHDAVAKVLEEVSHHLCARMYMRREDVICSFCDARDELRKALEGE